MGKNRENLTSRLIVGAFNGAVAFVLIAMLECFLVVRKGVTDYSIIFLNSDVLWGGTLVFFVLGCILGPENMSIIWGKVFGTNKK